MHPYRMVVNVTPFGVELSKINKGTMYFNNSLFTNQQFHISPPGTEYIISGGGGALWYRYDQESADILEEERGIVSEVFVRTWGFMGMTLTFDDLYFEFIDNEGVTLYTYSRENW